MADRTPIETKNLDIYGNAPQPWSRPHDLLTAVIFLPGTTFLDTPRPSRTARRAGDSSTKRVLYGGLRPPCASICSLTSVLSWAEIGID